MHTVIWTATFSMQAGKCRLSEDDLTDIVTTISDNPKSGDIMVGTGGARKLRHAGRNKGKSGGYRVIYYYAGDEVPVFLLAVYSKGNRSNLTKAERNELAKVLPLLAEAYKKNVDDMIANNCPISNWRR
jgi:hypothetical protein